MLHPLLHHDRQSVNQHHWVILFASLFSRVSLSPPSLFSFPTFILLLHLSFHFFRFLLFFLSLLACVFSSLLGLQSVSVPFPLFLSNHLLLVAHFLSVCARGSSQITRLPTRMVMGHDLRSLLHKPLRELIRSSHSKNPFFLILFPSLSFLAPL